jgi:hypothetical protein
MNRCKICNKTLPDPTPQIGSGTPYPLQIIAMLAMHIATEHPEQDAQMQASSMGHLGLARMMQFEIGNSEIREHLEMQRWNLLQQAMNKPTPDEIDTFATQLLKMAGREDNQGNRATCRAFIRTIVSRCFEHEKFAAEAAMRTVKPS